MTLPLHEIGTAERAEAADRLRDASRALADAMDLLLDEGLDESAQAVEVHQVYELARQAAVLAERIDPADELAAMQLDASEGRR